MAVHAVVVDAATVVSSNVAAEVALVLDVGFMMLLAISESILVVRILTIELALWALLVELVATSSKETTATKTSHASTCSCFSLLGLECLNILVSTASPKTSEKCIFALPALIVVQMIHRKFSQVIEIFALWVGQPLVQIKALVFSPQDTLLKDLFFQVFCLINMGLEPLEMRTFIELDELVACWAIGILQTDSKSVWVVIRPCRVILIPLLCDPLLDAFEMEYMLAA